MKNLDALKTDFADSVGASVSGARAQIILAHYSFILFLPLPSPPFFPLRSRGHRSRPP